MPSTVNIAMYYWTKHKTKLYKLFIFLLGAYFILSFQHSDTFAHDDSKVTVANEKHLANGKNIQSDEKIASKEIKVTIDRCNCSRTFPRNTAPEVKYSSTTCSQHSWARGRGQKVVGFSYYGDSASVHHKAKGYLQGIEDNMRAMTK